MSKLRHFFLLLSCFLLAQLVVTAQQRSIFFETLSIEAGLSQSSVFAIRQDSRGFLWLGTNDGLNRYDGFNFRVYKPDPDDKYSISGNRVFVIYEDRQGILWIGTDVGLNRYDRELDRFTAFVHEDDDPKSLINNQVHSICEDKEGRLWIGTRAGISMLDKDRKRFKNFSHSSADAGTLSNNFVWKIYCGKNGDIWAGTDRGLNKFEERSGTFKRYLLTGDTANLLYRNTVFDILEDSRGIFWAGTRGGLFKYVPGKKQFVLIANNPANPASLSFNNIYCLFEDKFKRLWVGTLGGGLNLLVKIDNSNTGREVFTCYKQDVKHAHTLSNNYIWSLYEDRSGILWIGTDIGLNKYDYYRQNFSCITVEPGNPAGLIDNNVMSILRDVDKNLWIGTRNGLSCLNGKTGRFCNYSVNHKNSIVLGNNEIKAIYEDSRKNIWIGTNGGGLLKYEPKIGKQKIYLAGTGKDGKLSDNKVISICEDKNGKLWLGTLAGINEFDPETERFTSYRHDPADRNTLSNDYVFCVYIDKQNQLWAGTNDGLNKFDRRRGSFQRFYSSKSDSESLSNNLILCINEDKKGQLWVGTNGGLHRYDSHSGKFTRFNEKNCLINNVVYSIQPDDSGNLWLASNNGLSRFNPLTKAIRNFTVNDGLPSNQFNSGARFMDLDGIMYFGGIKGLIWFYPSEVKTNPIIPQIAITDFLVLNRPVKPGPGSPLLKNISESDVIQLSFADNVFSFEFAALNYSAPTDNQYSYMMEGFDQEWQFAGKRRFVSYTNLDPGEYVFRVRGSNNDGIWNMRGAYVKIIIAPPYWQRWWFVILMLAALGAVIYLGFYIRMRQLLAIERIRFNIAADLHDDIGTQLTEISMMSDMMYHFQDTTGKKEMESIRRIGTSARSMIDNLSDIIWLVKPENDSLKELFLKLKDSFEEILAHSNILITFESVSTLDKIKLPMEYRKTLLMIFKEALHNCIKYSGCTEIAFSAAIQGREMIISIKDNGKGFDQETIKRGNGLDNMEKRARMVKGSLVINSKPDIGTTISFIGFVK